MARTGRPTISLDWKEAEKLLHMQCTDEEVANWFSVSLKTLKAACKRDLDVTYSQFSEQKRDRGKISLRRVLWQAATDQNPKTRNIAAMLFACKTLLGLREHDDKPKPLPPADSKNVIVYQTEWGKQGEPGSGTGT